MTDTTDPAVTTARIMSNPSLGSLTAADAVQRRAHLMADKDFVDRATSGGIAEGEMLRDLWMIENRERGFVPPSLRPPETYGDVLEQARGRDLELARAHAENLRERGVEEITRYEYQNDRPIPPERKAFHLREIKRLKSDQAFVDRYQKGDLEAVRLMAHHHVGSVMRVGTLSQIQEWEKAHFGKVTSHA
jgi:hypothetical protein